MKYTILVNEMNIRGGTHKQVVRLCEYLKKKNCDYELVTKRYSEFYAYPECEDLNIKCIYDENKPLKLNGNVNKSLLDRILGKIKYIKENLLLYMLIDKKSNIVNFHDNGMSLCMWMCIFSGKKIVWQINDMPGCFFEGVSKRPNVKDDNFRNKLRRTYYKELAKHTDYITVNVSKNKERVERCMKQNAKVLYCGTDLKEEPVICKKILAGKNIHLVSTGVFFPYRNYETLINVVDNLISNNVDCRLDIIGSMDTNMIYADKIKQQISELNLNDYVKLWGQVDENTYDEIYSKADIFLFLNIEQSWGLAVFEAMGRGLPVIVSNSVGAIELLNNNKDSIIVNPKNVEEISNVVKKLYQDPDYYNMISDNAVKAVQTFTWDRLYSSKMLNLFEELEKSEN